MSRRLFDGAAQQQEFVEALQAPRPFPPCILWCRERPDTLPFETLPPLSWQPPFVDRLAVGARPGSHPLHEAGAYYVLDFSSVFAASTLLDLAGPTDVVLDLCAAPGGKSVFAWRVLRPARLLSNEVVGKRLGGLIANLRRCGVADATVLHAEPRLLAERLPRTAQVVIVDAPCTGQSLLAKGDPAPGCFFPSTINGCANRQRAILAQAAALVAPGGWLAYMTCTYSPEEDEDVGAWLLKRFPQFAPVPVPRLASSQSHLADWPCYRLWPQSGLGAGAFTALFQNQDEGQAEALDEDALAALDARPLERKIKS